MSRMPIFAVLGSALICGSVLFAEEKKDPPRELRGPVTKVESNDPEATYVTITVKEKQPTDKEDMFREVDKDYRFRIAPSTKIIGLDGKPEKEGLKSLQKGSLVRVE